MSTLPGGQKSWSRRTLPTSAAWPESINAPCRGPSVRSEALRLTTASKNFG